MDEENSCVAVYEEHLQAETAVRQLLEEGFDAKKLSIIGKGRQHEEHSIGFYNTGDRMKLWGAALYSIGIPRDSIIRYETAIKSDQYLLIVHGDQNEVERAHDVLAAGDALDVTIHLS